MTEMVKEFTEHHTGEEQFCRGCVDQVFALKNVHKKYLKKKKDLHVVFMNLEDA